VPDARTVLLIAPLGGVLALAVGAAVATLRRRGVAAPYTRKLFHFAIFSMAAVAHAWCGPAGAVTVGSVVALIVVYASARRNALFGALARPTDEPRERWYVIAPLFSTAVGGVLSNLLFGAYAIVGYLVTGWGDAAAEPVGTRWGRHRYRVHSMFGVAATRSMEGSLAVLVAGAAAGFLALRLLDVPAASAALIAIAIAAVSAVVEAMSTHGLDNLTVQLAASGAAAWLVGTFLT
jgi:phytol kinase